MLLPNNRTDKPIVAEVPGKCSDASVAKACIRKVIPGSNAPPVVEGGPAVGDGEDPRGYPLVPTV